MEYAKDADISIHECFIAPESLVAKQGFTPEAALNVGTQIHTSPAQFGKVMAETNPRLAVAYHFFNDVELPPSSGKRTEYDSPPGYPCRPHFLRDTMFRNRHTTSASRPESVFSL
jgi:ribonuclease Z